jgi:hypothetical protein
MVVELHMPIANVTRVVVPMFWNAFHPRGAGVMAWIVVTFGY